MCLTCLQHAHTQVLSGRTHRWEHKRSGVCADLYQQALVIVLVVSPVLKATKVMTLIINNMIHLMPNF